MSPSTSAVPSAVPTVVGCRSDANFPTVDYSKFYFPPYGAIIVVPSGTNFTAQDLTEDICNEIKEQSEIKVVSCCSSADVMQIDSGTGRRLARTNDTNTTNVTTYTVDSISTNIVIEGASDETSQNISSSFEDLLNSDSLAARIGGNVSDVEERPWPSAMPSVSMAPSISTMPSTSPSQSAAPSLSFEPSDLPSSDPSSQPSTDPSDMPSNLPSISQMPSLSMMPSNSPTSSAAPSDCGENHAFLVAEADRLSSEASTLYDQAADLECAPSTAPSVEPSGGPTTEATISPMPSGVPSDMPTVIACVVISDESNCTSLNYCEWVTGNITSTTRMLRRVRRHRDDGDDTTVVTPPLDRADDGVCRPKEIPPRNDDDSPSAAPSSSPTPQCDCECSTKSSSTKSTTKSKSKSSKSKSSTITFPITLTRNRWRRHRTIKSSKKKSRRLGGVGRAVVESTNASKQDRIAQLERAYFASADFDIDLDTATLEEKYEAMLMAFSSTGDVENKERAWDADEEEGNSGDDISMKR